MNKSIAFITIAVIIVGALFAVMSLSNFQPSQVYYLGEGNGSNSSSQPSSVNQTVSVKISLAELAQHNTQPDCWVGYKGKAYDLTSWLPRHPGSVGAIAPYCGTYTEFENAFAKQHGTSKASLFMKVAIYKGDLE